eukprot:TRINITY_DN166_c0_g1_i1.p1 TRINITY_DN166_c0_g1~~TRINITY_DN166_c0_g1_i1.p1  ORF type:complete len:630 (-),score=214.04 TRINITY_DN166_c0_g1_i1:237-2126(-)
MVGIREPSAASPAEVPQLAQRVAKGPVPRLKKLAKPSKEELEEQIKQKYEEADALQKRIKEIKDILDGKQQSKQVITQEFTDARSRLNELNTSFKGLVEGKKAVRDQLDGADKVRDQMRANARALRDKLPFVKVEQIDEEVKRLEYRMQHTSLSLQEEKKIMQQIKELTKSRDYVKNYNERLGQITEDEGARGVFVEKIKGIDVLLSKAKAEQEEQRKVMASIKERETAQSVDLPALYEERNGAMDKARALREEVKQLRVEFRAKEEEYYQRQREVKQQEDADNRMRFERREAERKEREALRKQKELENFVEPFTDELIECDQLASFLQKYVTPSGDETPVAPVQKLEITAPKGVGELLLSKKSRNDEELDGWFAGFGGKGKTKKGKNPALQKTKDKATIKLSLSMEAVQSFAKFKLSPPLTVRDVPKSVEEVKGVKEKYLKLQKEAREARERKAQGLDVDIVHNRLATASANGAAVDSRQQESESKDENGSNVNDDLHIEASGGQELGIVHVPDEDAGSDKGVEQELSIADTREEKVEVGPSTAETVEDDVVSAETTSEAELILVDVSEEDLGIIAGHDELEVPVDVLEPELGIVEVVHKVEKEAQDSEIVEQKLPLASDVVTAVDSA